MRRGRQQHLGFFIAGEVIGRRRLIVHEHDDLDRAARLRSGPCCAAASRQPPLSAMTAASISTAATAAE